MRSIENRIAKLEHAAVRGETSPHAALFEAGEAKRFVVDVTQDCPVCRDRAHELPDGVALLSENALATFILSAISPCPPCRQQAAAKLLEMEEARE